MQDDQSKRGGARPGSGRKRASPDDVLKPVSVGMTDAQKEKLKRLGGAPWVRDRIDKAKEPPPKE